MAGKIIIQAADVWSYWSPRKEQLRNVPCDIAENKDYGIIIELSTSPGNNPEITVFADDDEIYREIVYGSADCNACVLEIYADYITGNPQAELTAFYKNHDQDESDDAGKDREYQIENREEELKSSVFGLLSTVFADTDIPKLDSITDEATDGILEFLYKKYKYPIYRPMVLEDDVGEFFEEYPYEHMVFEEGSA